MRSTHPIHPHTHTERTQWLSGERCKLMYGKIESIRFASIDWQAILKMLPRMWQREMEIEMCTLYMYIIYILKCASWTMSHFKPIVCKNFMRQLQIVCVWQCIYLGGSVSKCVWVFVVVVRSVYCSLYYLFWLHISAVGSDAVASKFFVAYFRVGATNSFAQAKEFAHTHTHTRAH